MAKAKAAVEAEVATRGPGREASEETKALMAKLTKLASRKNGITNIEAAAELGITTLKCSNLGHRAVAAGTLAMEKGETGRVTYTKATA
jgi:hypothetical protein